MLKLCKRIPQLHSVHKEMQPMKNAHISSCFSNYKVEEWCSDLKKSIFTIKSYIKNQNLKRKVYSNHPHTMGGVRSMCGIQ
jgi:hypothetical protein